MKKDKKTSLRLEYTDYIIVCGLAKIEGKSVSQIVREHIKEIINEKEGK